MDILNSIPFLLFKCVGTNTALMIPLFTVLSITLNHCKAIILAIISHPHTQYTAILSYCSWSVSYALYCLCLCTDSMVTIPPSLILGLVYTLQKLEYEIHTKKYNIHTKFISYHWYEMNLV